MPSPRRFPQHLQHPHHPHARCAALRHDRRQLCRRVAGLASGPDDALVRGFGALVAAVEAGFRHEELLLETLGATRVHAQREDNAVVLCALHRVLPDVERGDCVLGRQVLAALAGVLDLHRLSADLALALAAGAGRMRARGRAARTTQHVAGRSAAAVAGRGGAGR